MTAQTQPRELLSLAQWDALGEDDSARSELQEGVLIVSPKARIEHQNAIARLCAAILPQLPSDWHVAAEPELVLETKTPATVRIPDVVVHSRASGPRLVAQDVALVVEVPSPGTRGTDLVMKRHEYAAAQIPNYWIVDLTTSRLEALSLVAGEYVGDWGDGTVTTDGPVTVTLDPEALFPAR
ncbi:Uma2 family endonuclease [Gordonia hydrophobica]|uniref:Uma2 family endonuclease n=1 Tax=Gordonia hydrophobica TaxID=40516 RepID=A0ABZ2U2J6_9ACTN|nr:Uma2 family endonuclease [Gordonia hydrophobica]MBM7369051.1 Uma2 family endonuclease [Gordonia hydrophobica]